MAAGTPARPASESMVESLDNRNSMRAVCCPAERSASTAASSVDSRLSTCFDTRFPSIHDVAVSAGTRDVSPVSPDVDGVDIVDIMAVRSTADERTKRRTFFAMRNLSTGGAESALCSIPRASRRLALHPATRAAALARATSIDTVGVTDPLLP